MAGPLSQQELRSLIAGCAPELADAELRRLPYGWDNHVYRVGARLVAKVSRDPAGAAKLWKEGCVLPYARSVLGEVVPKLVRLCGGAPVGSPHVVLIYERIGGRPLAGRPQVAPQALTKTDHGLCHVFAELLPKIHGMGVPEACATLVPEYGSPETWASMLRSEAQRLIAMAGPQLGSTLTGRLLERLESYLGWLGRAGFGPKTIHGDIDPRNILVRGSRLVGLLDWGEFAVGDPAIDYAGLFFDAHLGRHVVGLQKEEDPETLAPRVRFHRMFVPLYWAAYGAARRDPELLRMGLVELRKRLRPPGWP